MGEGKGGFLESASGQGDYDREGLFGLHDEEEKARRPGPSWRALVLSIIAAIVLSVTATLLLGGTFGPSKVAPSAGCGSGSACCPPGAR